VVPGLIAATVALSVGVAGFPLIRVLAVMIPVSMAVAVLTRPRRDSPRIEDR
jgi:hypothetical protein